ncbi:aldo/keto reductase family protein [Aspergillus japonicus CBS 114.51]|uniref:D-xylose reductase [NAD(P)H] n=2 Tax=Aspergillus TaxID=5052 RepID=A0A2V5IQ76_ASPV1|nr:aldo/keto reductase family protein [Aspergillus japonicus CBS 114.51]PYI21996.1 aldo/keto reductase family protein [Aspergillus violaceofuscus CBS 115571]RAH86402.1 aldo/keto reductase family protein [Aspergillus japonicus CBS 114.51]
MGLADTRFKLNTGAEIPALGLGTWQSAPGEVEKAVRHAIQVGYRHIDTAFAYQNEHEVGKAINDAIAAGEVTRAELFVTTKLWCTGHTRVEAALDQSLQTLGLEYIDLYLVHWPVAMNPNGNHPVVPKLPDGSRDLHRDHPHVDTWKSMEKLVGAGKTKAIGVCNYSVPYLRELLAQATVVPAVNQIENHPALPQQEVVDFCREKGIHVTAYSPLGSTGSPLFSAEPVVEVAKKRDVSPATVLLSWHIARGSSVLAKSVTPSRIEANRQLVELDESDLATIAKYTDELARTKSFKRYVFPPFGLDFGFPDKVAN